MDNYDVPALMKALMGNQPTGDMQQNARNQALMQAGFSMMRTPGSLGQALGAGGMAGTSAYQDVLEQQRRQAAQQLGLGMQLEDYQRKQQLRDLPKQFYRSPEQAALAGGGGPTVANAEKIGQAGNTFDQAGYTNALAQLDPMAAEQYRLATTKDTTPIAVAPGATLVNPRTGQPMFASTKPATPSPLAALMAEKEALPPGDPRHAIYDQAINKAVTPAAGVSVNYGAPVSGIDAQGNPVFFQPGKGGGAPAIVPGVTPPPKEGAGDKGLTESQAKAAAYRSQMAAAENALSTTPIDLTKIGSQADVMLAGGPGNVFASPAAQKARQAQDQWSESYLRFKTGAAASAGEVELNNRTFFPKAGDSKEVIAQKAQARQQAMHDIGLAAGSEGKKEPTIVGWPKDKQVKRQGKYQGKTVVEYTDGTVEYKD